MLCLGRTGVGGGGGGECMAQLYNLLVWMVKSVCREARPQHRILH